MRTGPWTSDKRLGFEFHGEKNDGLHAHKNLETVAYFRKWATSNAGAMAAASAEDV